MKKILISKIVLYHHIIVMIIQNYEFKSRIQIKFFFLVLNKAKVKKKWSHTHAHVQIFANKHTHALTNTENLHSNEIQIFNFHFNDFWNTRCLMNNFFLWLACVHFRHLKMSMFKKKNKYIFSVSIEYLVRIFYYHIGSHSIFDNNHIYIYLLIILVLC